MSMDVQFAERSLRLLPELAAFFPSMRVLALSDVHLGKGEHFAVHGAPIARRVNQAILAENLDRMLGIVAATEPELVVVVGDLIHAPTGMVPPVVEGLKRLVGGLSERGARMALVQGNHDRGVLSIAAALGVDTAPRIERGGIAFVHNPAEADPAQATVCGHLHPAVGVGIGRAAPRVPAFWLRGSLCVLPAFGKFTGGVTPRLDAGDRLFAAAGSEIVEIEIASAQPIPAT